MEKENKNKKGGAKYIFFVGSLLIILTVGVVIGVTSQSLSGFDINNLENLWTTRERILERSTFKSEESAVISVSEEVSPSVVTVAVKTPRRRVVSFSPFGGFEESYRGGVEQDIGTGFVVSEDGLIVTNKHVVDDPDVEYRVITKDDTEYEVTEIKRDPNNDIAIIKIDASGLKPVKLGDSDDLKVGQFAIAIGTALGEFRHTVTTGVVSGLSRGISAGSPFQGFVENIENVIQTDAAINPGNSGGPLLNSSGEVIGVNVAVASNAENIGFAIPINVVKEGLEEFNKTGEFPAKAFLGVEYQVITEQAALLNEVPQGVYITNVLSDSAADKAGLQEGDIVSKIDGEKLDEENGLADVISSKKPGDEVSLEVYRDEETITLTANLERYDE